MPNHRSAFQCSRAAGFTLIELLVTICIIAILAALILTGIQTARQRAKGAKVTSDLRQIGLAMLTYAQDQDGLFPLSGAVVAYGKTDGTTGTVSWQEQLDSYVGQDRRIFAGPNPKVLPSGEFAAAYFNGCRAAYVEAEEAGQTPLFNAVRLTKIESPSKYILAGEIVFNSFTPDDADCDNYTQDPAFAFQDTGQKAHVLFADGHVLYQRYDPALMMTTYSP